MNWKKIFPIELEKIKLCISFIYVYRDVSLCQISQLDFGAWFVFQSLFQSLFVISSRCSCAGHGLYAHIGKSWVLVLILLALWLSTLKIQADFSHQQGHIGWGLLVYQQPYSKWCWIPCFWHEGKRVEEILLLQKLCVMLKAISCRPSLIALDGKTLQTSYLPWLLRAGELCDFFEVISRWVVLNWGNFAPQGTFGNVWNHFWLSQLGGRSCSYLVGRGHGYLLNILQCTGCSSYSPLCPAHSKE